MQCRCDKCGYTKESELWPWKAFLCDKCQKAADKLEAHRTDLYNHSAYLSHLASKLR